MIPTATDEIRNRIENFVEELAELVKRSALESVQQAFGGAPQPRAALRRAAGRTVATTARKAAAVSKPAKRGKRTGAQVEATASALLKYIEKHPGARMEQISAGMKMASKDLNLPLRKLKDERRLKTKGQKRATEYYAK
jgi:hypothetical protein